MQVAWQRRKRRAFQREHGYSLSAHYATGGLRQRVLERDNHACVKCGMTDTEHKARWGRPITIDHKDKDRSNNTMANLQTMCLICHGHKDLSPALRQAHVPQHKQEIITLRRKGTTYQAIADRLGFSIAAIWKWCKRWEEEGVSLPLRAPMRKRRAIAGKPQGGL